MLQNRLKGMIFYLNNQKRRHKSTNLLHFIDLGWVWNADISKMRHAIDALK